MVGGFIIAYVPATAFKFLLIANASLIIGIVVGAVIGFFGLMLWFARPLRIVLGVLILMLSLASFLTSDFGGLLLGMIMALVGGSLALAWVPTKVSWRQRRRARKLAKTAEPETEAAPEQIAAPVAASKTRQSEVDGTPAGLDLVTSILGDEVGENSPVELAESPSARR